MECTKETPLFYLNPFTGKVIKSTGKVYNKLQKAGHDIKDKQCLYDAKATKKCLKKLLTLYPNVYPSSNLTEIPKTYRKGSARAFIVKTNKASPKKASPKKMSPKKMSPKKMSPNQYKEIIGFVDKHGKKHRLKKSIVTKKKVPVVRDYSNILDKLVSKLEKIDETIHDLIKEQIDHSEPMQDPDNINILYNPLQNDFIPIRENLDSLDHHTILDIINTDLVPKTLPPISKHLDIAGFLIGPGNIIGFVDVNNKLGRFQIPIEIVKDDIITKTLPEVVVSNKDHIDNLNLAIAQSPMVSEIQKRDIVTKLNKLNGEQFSHSEQRCLSCNQYFLVWDPEYQMCKLMLKKEEASVQQPPQITELSDDELSDVDVTEPEPEVPVEKMEKLVLMDSSDDNIIGYMDVHNIHPVYQTDNLPSERLDTMHPALI
jgi:hypothetical protein